MAIASHFLYVTLYAIIYIYATNSFVQKVEVKENNFSTSFNGADFIEHPFKIA